MFDDMLDYGDQIEARGDWLIRRPDVNTQPCLHVQLLYRHYGCQHYTVYYCSYFLYTGCGSPGRYLGTVCYSKILKSRSCGHNCIASEYCAIYQVACQSYKSHRKMVTGKSVHVTGKTQNMTKHAGKSTSAPSPA